MTDAAAVSPPLEELETWKGFRFQVRPATPEDKEALADLFARVSPEDRRFRFLSGINKVSGDFLERLTKVDHERTEDFLAFDGDTLIASAMLAADAEMERAEVAISIRSDYKGRGVGWCLLDHAARHAQGKGIELLESIESRDNVEAISLAKEMGFAATAYPGDATLVLVQKKLA
ncbi:GNAT family N-acetyltransferase [Sphingosinicella terrae]|uniref:GNAT family N-acetyltransferase n=1 Tax=Sphingosinicella terrae TaxID=2172047 RepID=UPI000E0DA4B8|nr:GNAT family N-acetyltransferase [Sphingosinicella terrae]